MSASEDRAFLVLLAAVTVALVWILLPFYGAILWAVVFAILFISLQRRLTDLMGGRRSLAALATIGIIVTMVIVPVTLVASALIDEIVALYQRIQSGELDIGAKLQAVFDSPPEWAAGWLDRLGLTNLESLRERLSTGMARAGQFLATRAVNVGQNTARFAVNLFVMLYLLFFFLRDGDAIARRISDATPLRSEQQDALIAKFAVVIRATVKGNVVVALLQGALGGLIFWILDIHAALLWAVSMAILSLLPAVGAFLVWAPVGVYLLVTGSVWEGAVLIAFGVLVIGLVDNVVRPLLVGKETKMPDYIVLISTLGGIAVLGLNGFVLGPMIAATFIAAWDIHSTQRRLA